MIRKMGSFTLILLGLVGVLLLSACSGQGKTEASSSSEKSGVAIAEKGNHTQKDSGSASKRDSTQTEFLGEVTSIVGNEVNLAIGTKKSNDTAKLNLTGETKTFLIPVGLTLTQNSESGQASNNAKQPNAPQQSTSNKSTNQKSQQKNDNSQNKQGTKATSNEKTGNTALTRSTGFSSITEGMILQIKQKDINGTSTVTKVAVLSGNKGMK